MQTAILVDGGFFIKRYRSIYGHQNSPKKIARDLHDFCLKHILYYETELYRILFYDCPPIDKKVHNPITKKAFDFKNCLGAILPA